MRSHNWCSFRYFFNVHGIIPDDSLILVDTHSLLHLALNVLYEWLLKVIWELNIIFRPFLNSPYHYVPLFILKRSSFVCRFVVNPMEKNEYVIRYRHQISAMNICFSWYYIVDHRRKKKYSLSHTATCSCCTAVFTLAERSRFKSCKSSVYF